MKIRGQRARKMGIALEDFKMHRQSIVGECFICGDEAGGYDEQEESEEDEDDNVKEFLKFIIIRQNNPVYSVWSAFNVFCCLFSSYFYAYMAAFENPKAGDIKFLAFYGFELVFLISFLLNFIVEYTPEGSSIPVNDISLISVRYLKTRFLYDFIPLIPL